MHDVFISYSRTDSSVVSGLHDALRKRGREPWIDWSGVRPAETFTEAIDRAIDASRTFVFVLSPDSASSQICLYELNRAVAQQKRIVPVLVRVTDKHAIPEPLRFINWVYYCEPENAAAAVDKVIEALDTDPAWLTTHTRLLVRAREWSEARRNKNLLLHGSDLAHAEQSLARAAPDKPPAPTTLQREFVLASREAASARLRILLGSASLAAVVSLGLAWFANTQRIEANAASNRATAGKLATQAELVRKPFGDPLVVSAALAAESLRREWSAEGDATARRALAHLPRAPLRVTRIGDDATAQISPDGRWVAVARANQVEIIDAMTSRTVRRLIHAKATGIIWAPQSDRLVTIDDQNTARYFLLSSPEAIGSVHLAGGNIVDVAFSHRGKQVAFAQWSGWETDTSKVTVLIPPWPARGSLPSEGRTVRWETAGNPEQLGFSESIDTLILAKTVHGTNLMLEQRREPFDKAFVSQSLADAEHRLVTMAADGEWIAYVHRSPLDRGRDEVRVINVYGESTTILSPCSLAQLQIANYVGTPGSPFRGIAHYVIGICEYDGEGIYTWKTDGSLIAHVQAGEKIPDEEFRGESELAWTRASEGGAMLHSLPHGYFVSGLQSESGPEIAASPDGRLLTLFSDGAVSVVDAYPGSEVDRVFLPDSGDVWVTEYNGTWTKVALCGYRGLYLRHARRNQPLLPLMPHRAARWCAFSADGEQLYSVYLGPSEMVRGSYEIVGESEVAAWDSETGALLWRRPIGTPESFALSPHGQWLATHRADTVTVSESRTGEVLRTLQLQALPRPPITNTPQQKDPVDLLFNKTAERLTVLQDSRLLQSWNVATGQPGPRITLPQKARLRASSADGRFVSTDTHPEYSFQSRPNVERVWDLVSGRELRLVSGVTIRNVTFGARGRRIAAIDSQKRLHVWKNTGERLPFDVRLPRGHISAFSADETKLVTISEPDRVEVWDIATGRLLASLAHGSTVYDARLSPDDRTIVSRSREDLWFDVWRTEDVIDALGARATRNLTADEWARYLPDEPCRATFRNLPMACH